jgi:heptosyltransferase-3
MSQRSALVLRGGAIGDFILTLPTLELLRQSISDLRLEVMGNRGIVELATVGGYADAHHYLDTPGMAMLFAPGAPVKPELAEWISSFNLIVSYLFDPDGTLRANLEKAGAKTVLDLPHRVVPGQGHAIEQLARPLERIAMLLEPDAAPRITVPGAESRPGADAPRRIAVHPGSGSIHKNWPLPQWKRLGHELMQQFPGSTLILVTGEAELERGVTEDLTQAWSDLPLEHWDSLPLAELAQRLPSCTHFLGHDSGMSHLAAACGVPVHSFFAHTDPATWAARNPASPTQVCVSATTSLNDITWDTAWDSVTRFLERV